MSFLNSVLSSIGKDGVRLGQTPTSTTIRPKPPIVTSSATKPKESEHQSSPGDNLKRKAEAPPAANALKVPKTAHTGSQSAASSRSQTSSPAAKTAHPAPRVEESRKSNRPNGNAVKPISAASPKIGSGPSPAAAPASKAPAPKSGYLATLERAKAAQEAAKQFGQIKHTKKEDKPRLSRKEKERLAAEAAARQKDEKLKGTSQPAGRSNTLASADKHKKMDTGYKGTMRKAPVVAPPAYRGTIRPGGRPPAKERPKAGSAGYRSQHRPSHDDSEEDDLSEEVDEYDSASSDMEAGLDEIDEEEFKSTRLAKKEDEEALREEEALRRQKMERKKKLLALSAAAAMKKKVY